MKLLTIDTSGRALSAAISQDGSVLVQGGVDNGKNHSLELLPQVSELLSQKGLAMADMDAFAVTIGPGSFTGLRIGLATAKAWCHCLNRPLITISSMDALAGLCQKAEYAVSISDARRDEVYTALYRKGERISEDRAVAPEKLLAELQELAAPICFAGDGLDNYKELFAKGLGTRFFLPQDGNTVFMAGAAAVLAYEKWCNKDFTDAAGAVPVYLRLSEAEEKRLAAAAERSETP